MLEIKLCLKHRDLLNRLGSISDIHACAPIELRHRFSEHWRLRLLLEVYNSLDVQAQKLLTPELKIMIGASSLCWMTLSARLNQMLSHQAHPIMCSQVIFRTTGFGPLVNVWM